MATLPESLIITLASIIIVLLTSILFRPTAKKPHQPPATRCLRVDNIPADRVDDFNRELKAIAAAPVCRSLAPRDKKTVCATISIITWLPANDLSAWLYRNTNGGLYRYTDTFDGVTPLYVGHGGGEVDIIAVPGLGSHAFGSWKSSKSDDIWLRDFLPKDAPNIRVLLYGYDTALSGSLSKQSIGDLGGALLEQIVAFRARDGTSCRPIIFIGHSLGGLVIKEALVRARRSPNDTSHDLSKATYGLLFFGVPNLGLRNNQLETLVHGQPNQALIHDLLVDDDSEPSNYLKRLADEFSERCKDQYRVVSFFERRHSPTLKLNEVGKWCKTGPPCLLVTEKSATSIELVAVDDEDNVALDTDHSGLVKYDSDHHAYYMIVTERLQRLINEAERDVPNRFAKHSM
ncbi:uncharacterized protein FMAN_07341 [Fusarium mangiferae]|uniref:DUF676 domain-containing protein n=1 Tax=Fusarium mangiferae TaxID=192010 RepID=A0A1L7TA43_FUSMA|nr:uncharacterized protein FMAN_07341 [Fusarium mangiferae]CVK92445.1 uncharacterized protein FMAN_07341 [Fusarium mangiferae]